jgi:hypothetical protein
LHNYNPYLREWNDFFNKPQNRKQVLLLKCWMRKSKNLKTKS